jgi:NAD(P)-dependent dehydrogenase (short-subunit alcohol dehydrogenase family)
MPPHSFLITGANSGQGHALAHTALKAGHKVVATARNVTAARSSNPTIESQGGIWLQLDVTQQDCESIISQAVKDHEITCLINNAGYGLRGVLEDLTLSQIREQMDTNFFGAIAVTKGAIPHFREKKSGTIVMISSASALTGTPSQSAYSASKFALEGASESLAAELEPFGIRVILAVLGAFRTPFQNAVEKPDCIISEPYKGTPADIAAQRITAGHGRQDGNPDKAAQVIIDVVTGEARGKGLEGAFRLLLGRDAVVRANVKIESLRKDTEVTKDVAKWCSFQEEWDGYPPL